VVQRELGDADSACESFSRTIERDPENESARTNLASLLSDMGRFSEAVHAARELTHRDGSTVNLVRLANALKMHGRIPSGPVVKPYAWPPRTLEFTVNSSSHCSMTIKVRELRSSVSFRDGMSSTPPALNHCQPQRRAAFGRDRCGSHSFLLIWGIIRSVCS